MSFKPSRSLISAELYISSYFQSVAENFKLHKNEPPTPKYVCDLNKLSADENNPQNKLLIDFYAALIEFDKKKYEIKSNMLTQESALELKKLEENTEDLLKKIKNDEELWRYITNNTTGRQSLFYCINNQIMHKKNTPHSSWILEEFKKNNRDKNVTKALDYLNLVIDEKKIAPENILIQAQLIFDEEMDPKNKIKKMEELLVTPKDIEKKTIPEQTNQFIDMLLAYSLMISTEDTITDICLYGHIVSQFVESGFLSPSLQTPFTAPSNKIFNHIFLLRKNIQSYLYHHTLNSLDLGCLVNQCLYTLTHKYVQLVNGTDYSILPSEVLVDLIESVDYLAMHEEYQKVSPEKRKGFWKAVAKIISRFDDNSKFLQKVGTYIYFLIDNDDIPSMISLISGYLDITKLKDKRKYQSFLSTLQFINDLNQLTLTSKSDRGKDQSLENKFQIVIGNLKKGKYQFNFLQFFLKEANINLFIDYIKSKLTLILLQLDIKPEELSNNHESYALFEKAIRLLAKQIEMNESETQTILSIMVQENKNRVADLKKSMKMNEEVKAVVSKKPSSEEESTPFTPCEMFFEMSKVLCRYTNMIEKNIEASSSTPLDFKEYVVNNSELNTLDESNKKLIDLVQSLISILKKSEDSKKTKNTQSFEYGSELSFLILKANQLLSEIYNKNPELWKFIISSNEGRDLLYSVIAIDLDHLDPNKNITMDWKEAFLNDTSHPEETDFQQYLYCLIKYKLTPPGKFKDKFKNNPFLEAFKVVSKHYDNHKEKLQSLLNFTKTHSLVISDKIQKRIARRVIDSITYPFMMDIPSFSSNCDKVLLVTNTLVDKNILPAFVMKAQSLGGSSEQQVFMTLFNYCKHLKILNSNYTISKQFNTNAIAVQYKNALFMCLSYYYVINQSHPWIELTDESVAKDLMSGIHYLLKINYTHNLQPELTQYFWPAVIMLYSKSSDKAQKLELILGKLYEQNNYINALVLLEFILRNDPENKSFRTLHAVTSLIRRLPETDVEESRDEIKKNAAKIAFAILLSDIKNNKYAFDGITQTDLAPYDQSLRSMLQGKLKSLKSMITAAKNEKVDYALVIKLRNFVFQLGENLKVDVSASFNENSDVGLSEIEEYVLGCFNAMSTSYALDDPEKPSLSEYKPTAPVAKAHEPLVNFYLSFVDLIKLSHTVRISKDNVSDLIDSRKKVYLDLENLKNNHSFLFSNKILTRPAGRHVLYLLLLDCVYLEDTDIEMTRSLIELLRSSTSDPAEIEILDYFDYILNVLNNITPERQNSEHLNKNRLIAFYKACRLERKEDLQIKINTLKEIAMTPLIFSDTVPDFIPLLLQYLNAQIFFSEIDTKDKSSTSQHLKIIPTLSQSRYFPDCIPPIIHKNTQMVLRCLDHLSNYMYIYLMQFTLYRTDQLSMLDSIHESLRFQAIPLFRELSERDDWVTNDLIKKYSGTAFSMLTVDSNLDISDIHDFCESIVFMLAFIDPACDFVNEIHQVISNLYISGKPDCAESILTHFIDYLEKNRTSRIKKNNELPEPNKYSALLSIFKTFNDLRTFCTIEQSEINNILLNITKINSSLNQLTLPFLYKFPNLKIHLKDKLIEIINEIDHKILLLNSPEEKKSLASFQYSILQLAKLLECSEAELSLIKKHIHDNSDAEFTKSMNNPLFDSEVKATSKITKANRKKKKQLSKTQDAKTIPNTLIEKEKSPETAESSSDTDEFPVSPTVSHINIEPLFSRSANPVKNVTPIPTKPSKVLPEKKQSNSKQSVTTAQSQTKSQSPMNPVLSKPEKTPDPKPTVIKTPAVQSRQTDSTPKPPSHQQNKAISTTTKNLTRTLGSVASFKISNRLNHRHKAAANQKTAQNKDSSDDINKPKSIETAPAIDSAIATPKDISTLPQASTSTSIPDEKAFAVTTPTVINEPKSEEKKEENCFTTNETPLSNFTLFKNETSDDLIVNRDQLPVEFLKFSEDLYDLSYPVTQKDIYLTGGSLLYYYEKQLNPYDLDVIIFCKRNFILPLLSRKYYCVIMPHEGIHVSIPVQECDLLSVSMPLDINNYNEVKMDSTAAAYVRAPDGLYYINKQNNTFIKVPISAENLLIFDKRLKPTENPVPLTTEELNKIRILIAPFPCHVKSIEIDISCSDSELTENLSKRDLTISAACMKLVKNASKFIIEGSPSVIYSLRNKIISPVNPQTIFIGDFTQLFRYAKTKLKHPKYTPDAMLHDLINSNYGAYVVNLFRHVIFNANDRAQNITHLTKIGMKLDELFSRFDTYRIIEVLFELHIIKSMTFMNNPLVLEMTDILDNYLDCLPPDSKKLGLYYYLLTIARLTQNIINLELFNMIYETLKNPKEQPESKRQKEFKDHLKFIDTHVPSDLLNAHQQQNTNNVNNDFKNFVLEMKGRFAAITKMKANDNCSRQPVTTGYRR